jgi:hypothetical protein
MKRATVWLAALALAGGAQAQNILRGEYFIDQDQGFGQNIAFEITDASEVADLNVAIDLAGYDPGTHTIGIRTYNDSSRWSLTNFSKTVIIAPAAPLDDLVEVEYFLNQDPDFGEGLIAWTGNSLDDLITFEPDMSNAVVGVNTLFIRSRTSDGRWSLTNHAPMVVIDPDTTIGVIDRIETFALPGVDPGFGNADQHTVIGPDSDMPSYAFTAPVPVDFMVDSTLMVRSHDSRGFWSLTNSIVVDGYTNVEDLASATSISVYPNPFTDAFTVQTEDAQSLRVILYDPQGKLVYDRVITGNAWIDLSQEASGSYTAFFWKDLERMHRVSLVKQ